MKIIENSAVTLHLAVQTEDGVEIDSSFGKTPMQIIQGSHYLIEGLETAIEGKVTGDKINISVPPEKAYGERVDALMQTVPKSMFNDIEVEAGMQFRAQTDGEEQSVIVLEVTEDEVVVDGNHPLSGLTLNFDVEILDVREATAEEIAHGHVHDQDNNCEQTH